jgi:hypothetical protein
VRSGCESSGLAEPAAPVDGEENAAPERHRVRLHGAPVSMRNKIALVLAWVVSILFVPLGVAALALSGASAAWVRFLAISKDSALPPYEMVPVFPLPIVGALIALALHRRERHAVALGFSCAFNGALLGLMIWYFLAFEGRD